MIPPHLPARASNLKAHRRWQRIQVLLLVVFFALIAGGTGAMMVLGWVWPGYGGGDAWVTSRQSRANLDREQPDELILKQMKERIFSVYKELSSLDKISYLNQQNKLGEAVSVGSDGWLVMYLKDARSFYSYKKWRALSAANALYKVDSALYDQYTRLAYFKISPAGATADDSNAVQLKVVSFAENLNTDEYLTVFVNNNWHDTSLGELWRGVFKDTHLDSVINYAYDLTGGPFKPGAIVMNIRGRLAGFVTDDNQLLPSTGITRVLPQVLSQKKIVYPSFGAAGWFSGEQPIIVDTESLIGFAVKDVWSKSSVLRRGDIILEINGQAATDENLWYNLGEARPRLKVWRRDKIIELETPILSATPQSYTK